MITDAFLNSCFSLVLNKNIDSKTQAWTTRDILSLLYFYRKKEKENIPLLLKNKVDCLEKICELRILGRTSENILDSIVSHGEKFTDLESFIEMKIAEPLEPEIIKDNAEQVKIRKKLSAIFSNYDKMSAFLDIVKNATFKSIDDVVDEYEKLVKEMYCVLMESNRNATVEANTSLDIVDDDYSAVVDSIKKKYTSECITPSGYSVFDTKALKGGFEQGRLYVFAGGSSAGKSSLLINFISRGLSTYKNTASDDKKVYIYITLENLVDETLMRIYQSMFSKTYKDFMYDTILSESNDPATHLKNAITSKIKDSNTTVVLKYFPKFTISPTDVTMVIDEVASIYGSRNIKAVFLDYLDLLKLDYGKSKVYDAYRLELSHITSNLKDIAVMYRLPVITATQLGREVYSRILDPKNLNLGMISESIKKVEHADFISLMVKDVNDPTLVHMKIGKNRDGVSDLYLKCNVNFEMFKFCNIREDKNEINTNAVAEIKSTSELTRFDDVPQVDEKSWLI